MFFPFIFPQFIDFNSNLLAQFVILITTYIVLDFLSLIGYAMLAQKLIKWITANPKTINTISASVLVIIAINNCCNSTILIRFAVLYCHLHKIKFLYLITRIIN